jgi:hypothetical protein
MAYGKIVLLTVFLIVLTMVASTDLPWDLPRYAGDEPSTLQKVLGFSKYPGYSGNLKVAGAMTVTTINPGNAPTTSGQILIWSLTGLDAACVANAANNVKNGCGIHIHTGTSCASHDEVGGHYYKDADEDPWGGVVYVADSDGSSDIAGETGLVTTGLSSTDIEGHVMVVHQLESGARIACGVISGVFTDPNPPQDPNDPQNPEDPGSIVSGTVDFSTSIGIILSTVAMLT